ncbi:hypothetical protein TSUD_52620 [Trifolium subterraneum]|uniref:Uncharacterized protein n=1 Tax=Trifolium subterraneum TaxID=3900 RepID=A0A2Z6NQ49_TRISU|nr:hypothetical protein TSUD_52620 [Trifolium subterraneum]
MIPAMMIEGLRCYWRWKVEGGCDSGGRGCGGSGRGEGLYISRLLGLGLWFREYIELEDPLIIIHEKKISSINAIVKVLELALKKQIPLLIVVEDVESDALATLILNKLRAGI